MVWLCRMLKQPVELRLRQGSQKLRLDLAWALRLRQTMAQTLLLCGQVLPMRGSSQKLSVSRALRLAGHMRLKVRCTVLRGKAVEL